MIKPLFCEARVRSPRFEFHACSWCSQRLGNGLLIGDDIERCEEALFRPEYQNNATMLVKLLKNTFYLTFSNYCSAEGKNLKNF